MYDKELVLEILSQISDAVDVALKRFEVVSDVSYFTDSPNGKEKLDSICMLLIAIGESLKKYRQNNKQNVTCKITKHRLESHKRYERYCGASLF